MKEIKENGVIMSVKNIISVDYNDETGTYNVSISKGSNVAETAFGISVIIKCFVRDKIVDTAKDVLDLVNKYLNDSQFEEVT